MIPGFSKSSDWAEPIRSLLEQPELGPWLESASTKVALNSDGTEIMIHLVKPLSLYKIETIRTGIYQFLLKQGHDISVVIR